MDLSKIFPNKEQTFFEEKTTYLENEVEKLLKVVKSNDLKEYELENIEGKLEYYKKILKEVIADIDMTKNEMQLRQHAFDTKEISEKPEEEPEEDKKKKSKKDEDKKKKSKKEDEDNDEDEDDPKEKIEEIEA